MLVEIFVELSCKEVLGLSPQIPSNLRNSRIETPHLRGENYNNFSRTCGFWISSNQGFYGARRDSIFEAFQSQ